MCLNIDSVMVFEFGFWVKNRYVGGEYFQDIVGGMDCVVWFWKLGEVRE